MKRLFLISALLLAFYGLAEAQDGGNGIKVRFLGTGAADWKKPSGQGEFRRLSSILVNDRILVDFTPSDKDMLPDGCHPNVIFYTHSHGDHYNARSAVEIGIDTVYCSSSWAGRCRSDFARAALESKGEAPVIIPLEQQQEVCVDGVVFKALPANHYTGDISEQALIYLIVKGDKRVLYATDTGGITAQAAIGGLFGADGLPVEKRLALSGLIMESTVGQKGEENFRLFSHSCVETVVHTVNVLHSTGGLKADAPVYITHLARTLHPSQSELEAALPHPLKAAYDGLEIVF